MAHKMGITSRTSARPRSSPWAPSSEPRDHGHGHGDHRRWRGRAARPRGAEDHLPGRQGDPSTATTPAQRPRSRRRQLRANVLRRVVTGGTGGNANVAGHTIFGKTGTTDNRADVWFIGATPQLATAVWFGNRTGKRIAGAGFGGDSSGAGVRGRVSRPRPWPISPTCRCPTPVPSAPRARGDGGTPSGGPRRRAAAPGQPGPHAAAAPDGAAATHHPGADHSHADCAAGDRAASHRPADRRPRARDHRPVSEGARTAPRASRSATARCDRLLHRHQTLPRPRP